MTAQGESKLTQPHISGYTLTKKLRYQYLAKMQIVTKHIKMFKFTVCVIKNLSKIRWEITLRKHVWNSFQCKHLEVLIQEFKKSFNIVTCFQQLFIK